MTAILFVSICVVGCGRADSRATYWRAKADVISARDATAEAASNFDAGDLRFAAVRGDALYVPVVERRDDCASLLEKYGTNPVPETGCALEGESHVRYQEAAIDFSTKYNQEMLRLLNSQRTP